MSKRNITVYEGYTENKFWLLILPLQHCGHEGASLLILWQGMDAVPRLSNSVYGSCCVFIMFKKIGNPTACEMRSVICFLNAKNMKLSEIHHQRCDVYGEHAISSSVVQRWVRMFNEDAKMCMMICRAADHLL